MNNYERMLREIQLNKVITWLIVIAGLLFVVFMFHGEVTHYINNKYNEISNEISTEITNDFVGELMNYEEVR